jgi:hypothetical protein
MKTLALLLFTLLATPALAGNWFGSGPWANAAYYPGNLDGKYQAAVTGINTSGVLGFAIRDGAVAFREQSTASAGSEGSIVVNTSPQLDETVNYYYIFVNGRAFIGTTAAGINYNNSSLTGTLIGTEPSTLTNTTQNITSQLITNVIPTVFTNTVDEVTSQLVTNIVTTNEVSTNVTITNIGTVFVTNVSIVTNQISLSNVETIFITNTVETPVVFTNTNVETVFFTNELISPVVIATGVDGAFQANITGKRGVFTFQGPGQLSSPGPVIDSQQVNPITPFTVNGIRVSFFSQTAFPAR